MLQQLQKLSVTTSLRRKVPQFDSFWQLDRTFSQGLQWTSVEIGCDQLVAGTRSQRDVYPGAADQVVKSIQRLWVSPVLVLEIYKWSLSVAYCTVQGASSHSNHAAWWWWGWGWGWQWRWGWRWPRWCVVVVVVVVVVVEVVEVEVMLMLFAKASKPLLADGWWWVRDADSWGDATIGEGRCGGFDDFWWEDGTYIYIYIEVLWTGNGGGFRGVTWQWSRWRCRKWERMSLSGPKDGSILHCFGRCAYFSQWNRIATVKMSDQARY